MTKVGRGRAKTRKFKPRDSSCPLITESNKLGNFFNLNTCNLIQTVRLEEHQAKKADVDKDTTTKKLA